MPLYDNGLHCMASFWVDLGLSLLNEHAKHRLLCCVQFVLCFKVGRSVNAYGIRVDSITPPGPGRPLGPPIKYESICLAACLPSEMAQTTSD